MNKKRGKPRAPATLRRPTSLGDAAKAVWDKVVPSHPHLAPADQLLLTQFCEMSSQLDVAIELSKTTGPLATSEKGIEYMHPALQVVCALQPRVWRMAATLKIDASSRPATSQRPDIRPFRRA